MSTGPCEAAPIVRDCQFKKMVVVRPIVPKGLICAHLWIIKSDIYGEIILNIILFLLLLLFIPRIVDDPRYHPACGH